MCRREKLEYLVSTGKFEGKRAQGGQRQGYVAVVEKKSGTNLDRRDRDIWTTLIVNLGGHDNWIDR